MWERTLLVVNYDEGGGFYDHVAPPLAADERADEGFGQLGFRVPALVIGPYARAGHVSDVLFDHTSPLAHIQGLYGLPPLTERDAAANDLWSCIDTSRLALGEPAPPATLPVIALTEEEILAECRSVRTRPTGQPELARFLAENRLGGADRRAALEGVALHLVERAVDLGVCVVR
jgi:phospholipase C